MKYEFKPLHLYLGLALILVILVIVFVPQYDQKPEHSANNDPHATMPDDDIHKGFGNQSPNKSNVNADVMKEIKELKENYEKNPDDTLAARKYADYLNAAHMGDQALSIYEKILKKDSKRIDILFAVTFAYYQKKEFDKAMSSTESILLVEKNNTEALYNKGAIFAAKGNKDEAKKIWNDIIKRFPDSEAAQLAKASIERM